MKLRDRLGRIAKRNSLDCIGVVRGLGAMVAMDRVDAQGHPDGALAQQVPRRALDNGLILLSCGVHGNVIRFLMPLTISDVLLDDGLARLETTLCQIKGVG